MNVRSLMIVAGLVGLLVLLVPFAGAPAALAQPSSSGAEVAPAGAGPLVRVFRLDGAIWGVRARQIEDAIDEAQSSGASLFLLEVDTPGGDVAAMDRIVKGILNSEVPVCVFVTPRGAHAASAGFFLLLAADVAAMSPLTRTGSASPVYGDGSGGEDDVILQKLEQDLSALIRSAARVRGRPVDLAEEAVREAKAWSSEEALELKLVDLIVEDRDALVEALDGREVTRADGSRTTLELAGARFEADELSWDEELEAFLFHPWTIGILLSLAVIGIYTEISNPGLIFPGALGVVCLLIVIAGMSLLPVNYVAVGLILVGMVLFVLEVKIISYGFLSIGGAICLGLGLFLLFPRDVPGLALPVMALVPVIGFTLLAVGGVTWMVARTMRGRVTTGREGVVGLTGVATTDIEPRGTVFVRGEYWSATSREAVRQGTSVKVTGADGLELAVEPLGGGAGASSAREERP